MSPFQKYVARQSIERVSDLLVGKAVIDIGCGDGFRTALIAEHARAVHAADINPRAIAFAELIVDLPSTSFEVATASEVAEVARRAPSGVEVVTSYELIEHLSPEELQAFLSGAREVLADIEGWLILSTPNAKRSFRRSMDPHHFQEFSLEQLSSLLEKAGFSLRQIQGLYTQLPWRKLEHFADTVPFRGLFRWLARQGRNHGSICRTLIFAAQAKKHRF